MNLIFDCETTGLPRKSKSINGLGQRQQDNNNKSKLNYKNLEEFDSARLVSISWFLTQGDSIIEQFYFIIKPIDWIINQESTNIHGITHEYALENGADIKCVLINFYTCLKRCKNIVAHNIQFDENIIKSELFRLNFIDAVDEFKLKNTICTMAKGRKYMKSRKFPKLSELYKFLYNEEITNAHCALDDTKHCFKCYIKLFPTDPNIFYFGDKEIKLTEEQQKIVFEKIDKHMLIIAGAGAGKTSTIITRIKNLINCGINEDEIILTTFTRNSANDMRDKLYEIMGYKSYINVGTIDSIAKCYIEQNENIEINDVSEYAPEYLKCIKKNPNIIKKYKYLFVDEFQDINKVQFDIICEFYKNDSYIIGIGDDSQNIYEFRGSDIKFILNFTRYFKNSIRHTLTNNFRSTKQIVDFANISIRNNSNRIDKIMIAANTKLLQETHTKPIVKKFTSYIQQNEYILKIIQEYISKGILPDSICIMSSINKPLLYMSELLDKNGINNYYSNVNDDSFTVKKTGYINLNTIHRSKGLEWSIIFLINMDDTQNDRDYYYNKDDLNKYNSLLEASRRLFYVAITRAKRELYIFSSPNNDKNHKITRFVTELPNDLYTLI